MIPGINSREMQKMLKQLGVKSEEVEAERVVVEKTDGTRLVVENPSVTLVEMQGQKTLQVAGDFREEAKTAKTMKATEVEKLVEKSGENTSNTSSVEGVEPLSEINDVELVMQETGVSREEAEKALSDSRGDLAEAILKLQERGKRK